MGEGSIPGMGFLQMLTNGGKGGGGGSSVAPPGAPPVGGTPGQPMPTPSPGGAQPGAAQTPGYANPISLFGNMSDDDLATFMAQNGIRQPQGSPSLRPKALVPAVQPAPVAQPKRKINYETRGR